MERGVRGLVLVMEGCLRLWLLVTVALLTTTITTVSIVSTIVASAGSHCLGHDVGTWEIY